MALQRISTINQIGFTADTSDPRIANLVALQAAGQTALANNITFLGLAPPTFPLSNAAQQALVNQVTALTRQTNAVIRVLLNLLDSTSGT